MATTTTTMPQPLPLPSDRGHKFLPGVSPVLPSSPPRGHKFSTCGIRAPSRPAFTLVELLVVIGIIGMITAIAVPTIFGAIGSARNAKTKAEIDMLHMALMNYKNEYGGFPPANMAGLWNGSSVNTKHPVYKHLVRIFPRLNEVSSGAASPYAALAQISPAQALVFWLQGFYENPEYPLSNGGTEGSRKKLFEFDETRLYAASAYLNASTGVPIVPQVFAPRTSAAAASLMTNYPVYFTGHPSCGLPYVYFESRCYDNPPNDVSYVAQSTNGDASTAFPYVSAMPPQNPTWGQLHCAADTFQLIAAGKDGSYGTLQAAFPKSTTTPYAFSYSGNSYTRPYANDNSNAPGHADNITNFANQALADAIEALQSQ